MNNWYVYILRCSDNSLYCGITNDLVTRLESHNDPKSVSKYTRSRRPVVLVYSEQTWSKGIALKREWAIKQMSRKDKERLVGKLNLPTAL